MYHQQERQSAKSCRPVQSVQHNWQSDRGGVKSDTTERQQQRANNRHTAEQLGMFKKKECCRSRQSQRQKSSRISSTVAPTRAGYEAVPGPCLTHPASAKPSWSCRRPAVAHRASTTSYAPDSIATTCAPPPPIVRCRAHTRSRPLQARRRLRVHLRHALARDPPPPGRVLLHNAQRLQLLQCRPDNTLGCLRKVRRPSPPMHAPTIHLGERTHTSPGPQVYLAGQRCNADVVPVRVIGSQLLERRGFHHVHPLRQLQVAHTLQMRRINGNEVRRSDILHREAGGLLLLLHQSHGAGGGGGESEGIRGMRNAHVRTAGSGARKGNDKQVDVWTVPTALTRRK
eukprot:contig_2474_g468